MKLVTKGSDNVFRDLGLSDADMLRAKSDLVHQIAMIIEKRKLTQKEAAKILGINQPKVCALLHGRLSGFSLERIARFLKALDCQIEIRVHHGVGSGRAINVA